MMLKAFRKFVFLVMLPACIFAEEKKQGPPPANDVMVTPAVPDSIARDQAKQRKLNEWASKLKSLEDVDKLIGISATDRITLRAMYKAANPEKVIRENAEKKKRKKAQ